MKKVQMCIKTPLGTIKGQPQDCTDEEFAEKLEVIKDVMGSLTYLNFKDEDGNEIILPKAVLQNSVIYFMKDPK